MPKKYHGEEEKEPLGHRVELAKKIEKIKKAFGGQIPHEKMKQMGPLGMFRHLQQGDKPFRPGNPDPPHRLRRKFKYDPSKEGQN